MREGKEDEWQQVALRSTGSGWGLHCECGFPACKSRVPGARAQERPAVLDIEMYTRAGLQHKKSSATRVVQSVPHIKCILITASVM